MQYLVITTGSCGNCYVFYQNNESIIIDDGITMTKLRTELERHEIPFDSIKALFLTHLHPDHAKGAGVFMRKTGKPLYISCESYEGCSVEIKKQKIHGSEIKTFNFGDTIEIGSFKVTSFHTSHDSIGSSGYYIENGDSTVFLMTDTGIVPEDAYQLSRRAQLKFIEANYDPEMLASGKYPEWLKQRVSGVYGHLANECAIDFAKDTSKQGDQIYFIHISENNNKVSIVQNLIQKHIPSGIFARVLERGEMTGGFINE